MRKSYILFMICLLFSPLLRAQDQVTIDSLQLKLNNSGKDTCRINILLELSVNYEHIDLLKAFQYSKEALAISKEIKNEIYSARSYIEVASILMVAGEYDKALDNFLKGLEISVNNKFAREELLALGNIGSLQSLIGEPDKALQYYFEALNMYNTNTGSGTWVNDFSGIQSIYNNIGIVYADNNKADKAECYYLKALALAEQQNDNMSVSSICNNLADIEIQRKKHDKAYDYLTRALETSKQANDKLGTAVVYHTFSEYYRAVNQLGKALDYGRKSLDIGKETQEPLVAQASATILYEIYKKLGQPAKALEYLELSKQLSDSLLTRDKYREISNLQFRYDYEKAEREIKVRQQSVRFRYIVLILVLTLGTVILGLLFLLIRNKNKRLKFEKEQIKEDLIFKNKELTTNAVYLMKQAILVDNINAKLLKLKDGDNKLLPKILKELQSLQERDAWKEFEVRFQHVHEEFYQNLQQKFPELSPSEIKLAAFLRLNMTTKEIATLTGQNAGSIETARYRLRKKLGITNQELNLVTFLINI